MAPGSAVVFVDSNGKEHNALAIWVWPMSLNIAHVDPDPEKSDSVGNLIIKETSVPFYKEGMEGFYIKKPEEPAEAVDEPIDTNTEDQPSLGEDENIDGMGPLEKGVKETLD